MRPSCTETRLMIEAARGAPNLGDLCDRMHQVSGSEWSADDLRHRFKRHKVCCLALAPTAYLKLSAAGHREPENDNTDSANDNDEGPPTQPNRLDAAEAARLDAEYACRDWIDLDPEGDFSAIIEPESDWISSRVLIVPDSHWPFVSRRAWRLMLLAALRVVKPDTIVILGDMGDFYAVSQHDKDPRRVSRLAEELDSMRQALDELDSLPGVRRKVYCAGNHEWRQARFIAKACPQLDGLVQRWEDYLHLSQRGYEYVPYKRIGRVGNILVTHEAGKGGIYAAKRTLDRVAAMGATDIAFGHTHQLSKVVFGGFNGRYRSAMTCGWLGSHKSADYVHACDAFASYNHGFGFALADDTGHLMQDLATIYGDRAYLLGQTVRLAS